MSALLRHELRNALTAVIGYTDFLFESLESGSPEELKRVLQEMKSAGDATLSLVDSHLDPERLSALPREALPLVLREFSAASAPLVEVMEAACPRAIAVAEREGLYRLIPVLFKIKAAVVVLESLLEEYSPEGASVALTATEPLDLTATASPLMSELSPALLRPSLTGRVLVVDDNSISRDLLRQWLERSGHTVDEAGSGALALERLREGDYDVVLLDLRMPDMNGLEVLQALRSEGRLGRVPILMLSASNEVDDVARCIEHGADDYVLKPWNPVLLRARLRLSMELKSLRELLSKAPRAPV
jgi:two-component system response regulator